jgi:hypothetical protein
VLLHTSDNLIGVRDSADFTRCKRLNGLLWHAYLASDSRMSIDIVRGLPNGSYTQDDDLSRPLIQSRELSLRIEKFQKPINYTGTVEESIKRTDELSIFGLNYKA